MKKPSVFFAIMIYRAYEPESQKSLQEQLKQATKWRVGSSLELWEQSNITVGRNILCKHFLEKTTDDYFFLFDVDIVCFTDYSIDKLVMANKGIIAGAYIFKKLPYQPTYVPYNLKDYDLRGKTAPVECRYVSGGYTLIRREVLEMISKEEKPFATYEDADGNYLSEDWGLCDKAKKICGASSWIEPSITLGHLGKYPYSMLDFYGKYIDNPEVKSFDIQGKVFVK